MNWSKIIARSLQDNLQREKTFKPFNDSFDYEKVQAYAKETTKKLTEEETLLIELLPYFHQEYQIYYDCLRAFQAEYKFTPSNLYQYLLALANRDFITFFKVMPQYWEGKDHVHIEDLRNIPVESVFGNTILGKEALETSIDIIDCIMSFYRYFPHAEATKLLQKIFGDKNIFDTPKPPRLVEKILRLATDKDSIVLDSFAGSGTTAHAVLNLNAHDGGNRKFILVEMEDYADTITAERVRRVIKGYGKTAGTGGSFDFYEVGEPLMIQGNLNENIDVEKIRAYIWYTETHTPYKKPSSNNTAYLGDFNNTAYYFHYERDRRTTLDATFLRTIEQQADSYLIYADECGFDEDFLQRNSITFKKIPRDIKKIWSDDL